MSSEATHLKQLEARVEAMSTMIKTVLTTMVMRGILTRADVQAILHDSEQALAATPQAVGEVAAVREELPHYLRTAMGPPSDDDEHGGH
jgi:hypothetical protein